MEQRRLAGVMIVGAALCAILVPTRAHATGVPIGGFLPFVGISLTDKFDEDNSPGFDFYLADQELSLDGSQLGAGGTPFYDVALIDTGAAASFITQASDASFNVNGAGFRGTETLQIGGATGFLEATINDAMAIFASGLGNRTSTSPLALNTSTFVGQSSISLLTLPAESDLPNILGIPFSSQFVTYIRNDQPQIFQHNGKTVRTPNVEFLSPLGSGAALGITRRAPITLDDPAGFTSPPAYIFNFDNLINGDPLTDNPSAPTVLQAAGAYFLSVNVNNEGQSLTNTNFFFDTGADVTVVSEINAVRLGFDPVLDTPDFTIAVVGSGGVNIEVPGFYVESFTVQAVGGSVTLSHVPVVVIDVVNPAHPGNIVDGIVGMNVFAGRNIVIDPKPATGGGGVGPSLYISDPVTTTLNWSTAAASGTWGTNGNWSSGTAPTALGIANVRHVAGGNQTAVVATNATAWELNVSGASGQAMTVEVNSGVTLTTFSAINVEPFGVVQLNGGTLDAQFVEVVGGTLRGTGSVKTGTGPIPGQVENPSGTVAPGNGVGTMSISGRFANGPTGTLAIELGGTAAGTQYDQLLVDGPVTLDGTLSVSLVNLGGGTFAPTLGNTFTIITATDGLSGAFESVKGAGLNWKVLYNAANVQLVVGVAGDYNDNGIVDSADYSLWRDSLGSTTNLAADGNGNSVVDMGDYTYWKSRFGNTTGTGGSGSTAAVPEPSGLTLMLASFSALSILLPFLLRAFRAQSR